MKKKVFACSDIHGHYQETLQALQEAGWDENNENHLLIVCGDIFDRGRESWSVYKWLKRLTDEGKAIVTKGNHDDFLIDFMGELDFNHTYGYNDYAYLSGWNGVNETIDDFLHSTSEYKMFALMYAGEENTWDAFVKYARKEIKKENPGIVDWLNNLPDYYETKNYIFTHGSIDPFCYDWKNPYSEDEEFYDKPLDIRWRKCHWDDGTFLTKEHKNTDKTVVVGHFGTGDLRSKWQVDTRDINDYSILKLGKKIFLDGCTILTKKVNVLVIDEEELLENNNNEKEVNENGK